MVARFENPLVMVGRFGGSLGNTVLKLKGLEDPWVIVRIIGRSMSWVMVGRIGG